MEQSDVGIDAVSINSVGVWPMMSVTNGQADKVDLDAAIKGSITGINGDRTEMGLNSI